VPLAVLGALLGLYLFGKSLNLFSQIGIVMLVGLAAKNGILIVEFANQRPRFGPDGAAGDPRRRRHAHAADPDDFDRDDRRRDAADARHRRGCRQPYDDRRRGGVRRGVVDLAVAVRGAGVLPDPRPRTRPPDERKRMLHQLDHETPSVESDHG
jgi:hypothetical protein